MGISDKIEAFISELLKNESMYAEFGRNELADLFGCVPSQINYVISTRFSPEKGYRVESRRGGGGYIKISRIDLGGAGGIISEIPEKCTEKQARAIIEYLYGAGLISEQAVRITAAACGDKALRASSDKDRLRSDILKNIIIELK